MTGQGWFSDLHLSPETGHSGAMLRRLLIALLIAISVPAVARPSPLLRKGQTYSSARSAIRRAGWSPYGSHGLLADGSPIGRYSDAGEMIHAGMTEVIDCGGIGLNSCEFRWRHGSRCLRIFTIGEFESGVSPVVDSSEVVLCSSIDQGHR